MFCLKIVSSLLAATIIISTGGAMAADYKKIRLV